MELLKQIQEEMVGWQAHNFPGRPTWVPLLGIVEEIGELSESLIVGQRGEILDAIGDTCIYMADYCNGCEFDLNSIWFQYQQVMANTRHHHLNPLAGLQIEVGILAHTHIKVFQNIRRSENHRLNATVAIGRIVYYLNTVARGFNMQVEEIAMATWTQVRKRDWQKNPDNAHQIQSGVLNKPFTEEL